MDAKTLGLAVIGLCALSVSAQEPEAEPATVEAYAEVLRETRGLREYNALRTRQIAQQEQKLVELQRAIEGVPELELQIPPLLKRMVDTLSRFVEIDMPLERDERRDGVESLYELLENSEPSSVAKLRRIFEAWWIEVQYGSEFHSFPGKVPGTDRDADFLALGRVGLFYQTPDDEALTGAWDCRIADWVPLGSEHRNSVRQALRMARAQIAPELVLLPILPAQTADCTPDLNI